MANLYNVWQLGELVLAADLNTLQEATMDLVGQLPTELLNATNLQMDPAQTVTLTPGGGLNLIVGGSYLYLQGRFANVIGTGTLTFASNSSGSNRVDLIEAQYVENEVNPFTRNVRQPGSPSSPVPTTCYQQNRAAVFQVKEGSGPGGPPAPDTGWVSFASVTVPSGATALNSGNVQMLFNTIGQAIVAEIISYLDAVMVTSLNSLVGPVTLSAGSSNVTLTPSGNNIAISVSTPAVGVTSLDTLTGALTLSSSTLTITPSGSNIDIEIPSSGGGGGQIGSTVYAPRVQFSTGWGGTTPPTTATFGSALGTGTWSVYATCSGFGLQVGQYFSMAGTGISHGAGWDGNVIIDATSSDRYAILYGVAGATDTPTVTIQCNGGGTAQLRGFGSTHPSTYGLILMWAVRTA